MKCTVTHRKGSNAERSCPTHGNKKKQAETKVFSIPTSVIPEIVSTPVPSDLSTVKGEIKNREYQRSVGIDPDGEDDSVFETERVYCASHQKEHSTGWCTVSNQRKVAV